jgi:large subunit ribosomal protein L6
MSKIGKQPIIISSGVTFSVDKDNQVSVKGPKGDLSRRIDPKVSIEVKNGKAIVSLKNNTRKNYAIWGLSRMLIFNMIEGVEKGFEKKLEIQGIGYKAIQKGKDLELALGFSHPVLFKAPQGIEFKVEKNIITVSGFDKQLVGQVSADIRSKKKPEPYKGKGIRYIGEHVRRKSGKKVAGTEK